MALAAATFAWPKSPMQYLAIEAILFFEWILF